jgi:hypothetical protein
MAFKVGDLLLCINGEWTHNKKKMDEHAYAMIKYFPNFLGVYTVRHVKQQRPYLTLVEIVNPLSYMESGMCIGEVYFFADHFIKLPKPPAKKCTKTTAISFQFDLFLEHDLELSPTANEVIPEVDST